LAVIEGGESEAPQASAAATRWGAASVPARNSPRHPGLSEGRVPRLLRGQGPTANSTVTQQ
jgi:hypothetical protein